VSQQREKRLGDAIKPISTFILFLQAGESYDGLKIATGFELGDAPTQRTLSPSERIFEPS
jgi:hypothetical protein